MFWIYMDQKKLDETIKCKSSSSLSCYLWQNDVEKTTVFYCTMCWENREHNRSDKKATDRWEPQQPVGDGGS